MAESGPTASCKPREEAHIHPRAVLGNYLTYVGSRTACGMNADADIRGADWRHGDLAVMKGASTLVRWEQANMLTLYSYPDLFGCADNNPFGLKVYAFLKLCGLAFRHEHIFDASKAPRSQLPYLADGNRTIGDSDAIISYLITEYALTIDDALLPVQQDTSLLLRRMLDDLYWVMSYSRWKDDRFFPLFRDATIRSHSEVTAEALEHAREFNSKRYHFQGIGRYEPEAVYARGIASLHVLANQIPASGFVFGAEPSSIDAAIYGFIANIYYFDISTPLREFVLSQPTIVRHCEELHAAVRG